MKNKKNLIILFSVVIVIILVIVVLLNLNKPKKVSEDVDSFEEGIAFTDNIINLDIGENYQLDVQVNSSKKEEIIYIVNDDTIATVSNDGMLEAKKSGTAIISAMTVSGLTSNVELIVKDKEVVYVPKTIPINKIEIETKDITLSSGQTYQIKYKILPENATDKTIMWETNDARIATVSDTGLILARQSGTVKLTAYSIDGILGSVDVTVDQTSVSLSDFELNPSEVTLYIGNTYQMSVTYIPSNASNKVTSWTSSNSSVVTVNNGLIVAKGIGSALITATSNGISKSANVIVTKEKVIEITSVELNKTSLELNKNQTYQLSVTYLPNNAVNTNFIWSSSDSSVATISNTGLITALKGGTTTIMVKSTNGKSDTLTLTVKESSVTNPGNTNPSTDTSVKKPNLVLLNLENVSLKIGATKQLRATILPLNASQAVTWFTGDSNVVSVSSNGLITAKKTGKTTVSALTSNGLVAKCTVTVRYPLISIETASNIPAPGSSISSEEVSMINDHLSNYIEEMGEEASLNGQNSTRAKVIAAAFFLAYNPYYQVSYNFSGKDSIGSGWFKKWGNSTNDSKYPVKGIDCNAFIRWSFYQVLGKDIGSIGRSMRIRSNSGLRVGDVAAVAEPGDVIRKDQKLMGGVSGHVAFIYSVDRENGTVSIIHAGGSKIGVAITTYTNSNSTMNFNYLYDMNYIYGD